MRIKKLELIGFKSFADPTEILLNEGVTCIVGPNGCGKSNISDAIRWVLGERSAKLLRGSQMQDVIFNGTDFRKPLSMAEVSLIVDNADHRLAIPYEEVVFTRRLYRSGESEYLLNRTPCRLKDILDLILDTGMGSNAYSMMEQGRIDFILSADPEERRFLIEEAAGISKYKVKKEEALRKLERTEQNLLRVRDIVNEVKRNIQYAERQAKRAAQYKAKFDTLKTFEIRKAFLDLSLLNSKKIQEEELARGLRQEIERLETETRGFLEQQGSQKDLLDKIIRDESGGEARRFDTRSEFQSVTQKREFDRERLQEFRARQIEIDRERENLRREIEQLEEEIQIFFLEREEFELEHSKVEQKFQQEKTEFEAVNEGHKDRKSDLEKIANLIFDQACELAELHNELNRLDHKKETSERERKRGDEIRQKLADERATLERKRIAYQEGTAKAAQEMAEIESQRAEAARRLDGLREELNSLEKQAQEKRTKCQEIISRLRLLKELEETASEIEEKLLASFSQEGLRGKLVRSLKEVLRVERGYESAVEAVLGTFAQGLIAEDVETAKGLMAEMGQIHAGPCGIFIQSLIQPTGRAPKRQMFSHPSIRRPLQEVVEIQKGLEPLFETFFEDVYVVEDFTSEKLGELLPLAQNVKLVTKEGILLGPEARVFFRNGRISPNQGSFHRQGEIEKLTSVAEELVREVETIDAAKEERKQTAENLEQVKESLTEKGRERMIAQEATESLLRGLLERELSLMEELRVLEFEMKEFAAELEQGGGRRDEILQEIGGLEKLQKELMNRQGEVLQAVEYIQDEREKRMQALARLTALFENHSEKLRSLEVGERLLRTQLQSSCERAERLQQEGVDLDKRIQEIRCEEQRLEIRQKELEIEQARIEASLSEIRGRKGFQAEELRKITTFVSEGEQKLRALKDLLHQRELALMDLSYQDRTIVERMEQGYRVKMSELKSEDFLQGKTDPAILEEEILTLKENVQSFGAVNLLAVEEYDELKKRYEFLASQESDLNRARESLLEAVRKINRTTKALFSETFEKVQAAFLEHFKILFQGGHAELILLDGENPQESGVDIFVRPPGKKPQHISLLSGGEKALTALALLFALFRIKPSPFCVLDEVDAPLDEANIDRFLTVLRSFLGSTQFLIVTHNRKTIAMSNFLYGVTMEESGVSKLVSVKLMAQEAPEEAKAAS